MTTREKTIEELRVLGESFAKKRNGAHRKEARHNMRLCNRRAREFEAMSDAEFEARFPDVCEADRA